MTEMTYLQQFQQLKTKYADALFLFRCGDFYEAYGDDAEACSKELGVTLSSVDDMRFWPEDRLISFPHHALDAYLPKLVRNGHRVAIVDQLEDPRKTKQLVKRDGL